MRAKRIHIIIFTILGIIILIPNIVIRYYFEFQEGGIAEHICGELILDYTISEEFEKKYVKTDGSNTFHNDSPGINLYPYYAPSSYESRFLVFRNNKTFSILFYGKEDIAWQEQYVIKVESDMYIFDNVKLYSSVVLYDECRTRIHKNHKKFDAIPKTFWSPGYYYGNKIMHSTVPRSWFERK